MSHPRLRGVSCNESSDTRTTTAITLPTLHLTNKVVAGSVALTPEAARLPGGAELNILPANGTVRATTSGKHHPITLTGGLCCPHSCIYVYKNIIHITIICFCCMFCKGIYNNIHSASLISPIMKLGIKFIGDNGWHLLYIISLQIYTLAITFFLDKGNMQITQHKNQHGTVIDHASHFCDSNHQFPHEYSFAAPKYPLFYASHAYMTLSCSTVLYKCLLHILDELFISMTVPELFLA